jgi:hypothetical protein
VERLKSAVFAVFGVFSAENRAVEWFCRTVE